MAEEDTVVSKGEEGYVKIPYCSRCFYDGPTMDDLLKADYMVKGRIINPQDWDDYGGTKYIPYRGNVCYYHYQKLLEDGANIRIVRSYPAMRGSDKIIDKGVPG